MKQRVLLFFFLFSLAHQAQVFSDAVSFGEPQLISKELTAYSLALSEDFIAWGGGDGVLHIYDLEANEIRETPLEVDWVGGVALFRNRVAYVSALFDRSHVSSHISTISAEEGLFDADREVTVAAGEGEVSLGGTDAQEWIAWTTLTNNKSVLHVKRLGGREIRLPHRNEKERWSPRQSGEWLVWLERPLAGEDRDAEVMAMHLPSEQITQLTEDSLRQASPDVSPWGVVWREEREDYWRIAGKAWSEEGPRELTAPRHSFEDHLSPRLWQNLLVWERLYPYIRTEIVLQDLSSGEISILWSRIFEIESSWREGLSSNPVIGEKGVAFLNHEWRGADSYPWPCPDPWRPYPGYPYWPQPGPGECPRRSPIETQLLWLPFRN